LSQLTLTLEVEGKIYHIPEQSKVQSRLVLGLLVHIGAVLLLLCGEQNARHSHNLNTANVSCEQSTFFARTGRQHL